MLSIVMPVFNGADTLMEAYASISKGVSTEHEIIFVDDASSDSSKDLIGEILVKDKTARLMSHDRNLGGGAARNTGVRSASYDIVFVLDCDDVLVPGALDAALNELISSGVDGLANGYASCFRDDINRPVLRHQFRSGDIGRFSDLLALEANPYIGNLLFKRNVFERIGGYPEHHGFDTHAFGYRLLGNGQRVLISERQLYHQRLPTKPSYYMREVKSGNAAKNWQLIFLEFLYKFNSEVRRKIIEYQCYSPSVAADRANLYLELASENLLGNIFDEASCHLSVAEAFEKYKSSDDQDVLLWLSYVCLLRGDYRQAEKYAGRLHSDLARQLLCQVLVRLFFRNPTDRNLVGEYVSSIGASKTTMWVLSCTLRRVQNKIRKIVSLD